MYTSILKIFTADSNNLTQNHTLKPRIKICGLLINPVFLPTIFLEIKHQQEPESSFKNR